MLCTPTPSPTPVDGVGQLLGSPWILPILVALFFTLLALAGTAARWRNRFDD